MRILLAEDDTNISVIAKMALEHLGGHQVSLARDGEQALEMAQANSYDLILLDEMMPRMNGLSVCREYKSNPENTTPVIFLSAKSQESDIREFTECAHGHIVKPFDPTTLCATIEEILKGNKAVSA